MRKITREYPFFLFLINLVELKVKPFLHWIVYHDKMFLINLVELKGIFSPSPPSLNPYVSNKPCGVESKSVFLVIIHHNKMFLINLVELKVN